MYGELIRTVRAPLVAASGLDALRTFCSLLETAVAASRPSDDEEELEDSLFVWGPEIEGAEQVRRRAELPCGDRARQRARPFTGGDEAVEQVVDVLMQHRFTVFGRISLFVLRERAVLPMIQGMLANRGNFDALGFRREYSCCFEISSCASLMAPESSCSVGLPKHPRRSRTNLIADASSLSDLLRSPASFQRKSKHCSISSNRNSANPNRRTLSSSSCRLDRSQKPEER